jgi:hypothetical protein
LAIQKISALTPLAIHILEQQKRVSYCFILFIYGLLRHFISRNDGILPAGKNENHSALFLL